MAISRETLRSDSAFYLTMAIVSAALVFVGFAPSFYLKSVIHAPVPPLTLLTVVHGMVFTVWVALFLTQASLISVGNVALHRQLGIVGAVLFGAMLSLGYSVAITAGHLGHAPPGAPAPLAFMALPLIGITGTAVLVATALLMRKQSDWHKRLMLVAMFTLTPPGTARIAIPLGLASQAVSIAFGVLELMLVIAMAYDWSLKKRIHPAYLVGAAVVLTIHVSVAWAFSSPAWLKFAHAMT